MTEESCRNWFKGLIEEITAIGAIDIFEDPSRVYNLDESNLQLCPSTGRVVGFKSWKNCYELAPGPEKSTLTFVGNFNARGDIVIPAIIFPYTRVPSDIAASVPDGFFLGHSETGWMKSENFYEYLVNGFIPYLKENEIKMPIILFVDGHSTHLTLQASKLCDENDIILYLLPPNTTHILQPADVSVFRSFKSLWRRAVHDFQRENPNAVVRRNNVGSLVKKVLDQISRETIINGFVATGLCPLNPDRPDYTKCLEIQEELEEDTPATQMDANMQIQPSEPSENTGNSIIIPEMSEQDLKIITRDYLIKMMQPEQIIQLNRRESFPVDVLYDIWEKLNANDGGTCHLTPSVVTGEEGMAAPVINLDQSVEIAEIVGTFGNIHDYFPRVSSEEVFPSQDSPTPAPVSSTPPSNSSNILLGAPSSPLDATSSLLEAPTLPTNSPNPSLTSLNPPPVSPNPPTVTPRSPSAEPPSPLASSTSSSTVSAGTSYDHVFWDAKIVYKRKKAPKSRIPAMISSSNYRKFFLQKESAKKTKKKKNSDNWECVYCHITWSEDESSQNGKQWINCDHCESKMHTLCIPTRHQVATGLSNREPDADIDFSCEGCFNAGE